MTCRDSLTPPAPTLRVQVSYTLISWEITSSCKYCVSCVKCIYVICLTFRCDRALGADPGSVSEWEAQTQAEHAAVAAADLRSADHEGLAGSVWGWTQPAARARPQHRHTHHPAENKEAQGLFFVCFSCFIRAAKSKQNNLISKEAVMNSFGLSWKLQPSVLQCQFWLVHINLCQSLYSIFPGTVHEVQLVCSNLTPLALFMMSYFMCRALTILSFHSPLHTNSLLNTWSSCCCL